MLRTPYYRKIIENLFVEKQDEILIELIKEINLKIEELKKDINQNSDEIIESICARRILEKREGEFVINSANFVFEQMFKFEGSNDITLTEKIINIIKKRNWIFLYASKCDGFIISDNPFALIPPDKFKFLNELTISTPGVKITCPLTKNICLQIIENGNSLNSIEINQNKCDEINHDLAKLSDRFVFSHDVSLLKKIVNKINI